MSDQMHFTRRTLLAASEFIERAGTYDRKRHAQSQHQRSETAGPPSTPAPNEQHRADDQ